MLHFLLTPLPHRLEQSSRLPAASLCVLLLLQPHIRTDFYSLRKPSDVCTDTNSWHQFIPLQTNSTVQFFCECNAGIPAGCILLLCNMLKEHASQAGLSAILYAASLVKVGMRAYTASLAVTSKKQQEEGQRFPRQGGGKKPCMRDDGIRWQHSQVNWCAGQVNIRSSGQMASEAADD